MKKLSITLISVAALVAAATLISCVGCSTSEAVMKNSYMYFVDGHPEASFILIRHDNLGRSGTMYLIYNESTKVMYSMSHDGVLTELRDASDKPLLYKGDN